MEYSDYLALLSELCQLFDQISHVEQQKIDAVQGHALDELNEAMKREQALTLALRAASRNGRPFVRTRPDRHSLR